MLEYKEMKTTKDRFTTLLTHPTLKKLSWYTLAQIVVQSVGFLSAVIVSRYLGPVNLGFYSFALNYVGATLAVVAGMDFYYVWKLAKTTEKEKEVFTFIGHKINTYLVLIFFGTLFAYFYVPETIVTFVFIILLPSVLQSFSVFTLYTAATERARLLSMTQITSSVLLFFCKVILVQLHAPLYAFIIIASIDLVINGLILFFYFIRKELWRKIFVEQTFPRLQETFSFILSIKTSIVALGSWQLLLRVDQLVLATVANANTLGLYFASTKIAEMPNFLAGVLSTALIQKISHASINTSLENKKRLQSLVAIFFVVGALIAISIILFAPIIVSILYGETFKGATSILRVYSLSIPPLFLNYLFLGIFGSKEKHTLQMLVFVTSLAVNATLVVLLTPLWGAKGAALGTVVAYSCSALFFYLALLKEKSA